MKWAKQRQKGFTIVELLIVVVVIAILAAITVVAFAGVQQKARDAQTVSDVQTIAKALELYYIDNGRYPTSACAVNCKINGAWSSTSDGSWPHLVAQLVPKYLSEFPSRPAGGLTAPAAIYDGQNYDYVSSGHCSLPVGQSYQLAYKLETSAQKHERVGNCSTGSAFANYGPSSEYMVIKGGS